MAAIAGALASPTIQTGIYKGAKETRPLVRLQRSRASIEGEGTFDASKATYDASVAAPSARGEAGESPRSSPAYNASKSKFRNLSKNVPAGASSSRGEPSSRAAASESTFDGKVEAASNATFDGKAEAASNATFDGKAEAASNATFDGKAEGPEKTSIGLSARLARASMANMDEGTKSQRGQGSQRAAGSSARSQSSNRAPSKDDDSSQHL